MSDSSSGQTASTALASAADSGATPEPVRGADGIGFQAVLAEERERINALKGTPADAPMLALALSGGGIRSATFNLGVLQALARAGLLERLDYLSTVSGGGYIGSWLSAWIHRESNGGKDPRGGLVRVQRALSRNDGDEPQQVSFLREYSNYLTPKSGLLTGDTLAGIATYTRNLLLNLSILVLCLSAALLLPRAVTWLGSTVSQSAGILAWLPLVLAMAFINLNLAYQLCPEGTKAPWFTRTKHVMLLVVVPLAVCAALLSFWLTESRAEFFARWWWAVLAAVLGVSVAAWSLGIAVLRPRTGAISPYRIAWRLAGLAAGILTGLGLLYAMNAPFTGTEPALARLHATVWGLPAALAVFGVAVTAAIGLTSRQFEEESREWWSRLGGALIGVAVIWVAFTAAALYGPYLVNLLTRLAQGLGVAWIVSTAAGVWMAKSRTTGTPDSNRWIELLPKVAPYVFIAGLLIALSYALHLALAQLAATHLGDSGASAHSDDWALYAEAIDASLGFRQLVLPFVALLAVATFLVWRVDINLFSFHMFYRNRLMRCYLGASHPARAPHPYTGFDPKDSVPMKDLVQRPYHLVNTALNVTKGERLAWQERKAAAFVLSPLYCGYEFAEDDRSVVRAYQKTADYVREDGGHLTLGAALTISGAAASPNMGYHSSTPVAFLMTVFNVRLGWWMQNSRFSAVWKEAGPKWGFNYFLSELAGATNEKSSYVYLSDGGHFDNLGLYELVRRRCRFIIACDAGMDSAFGFEDLGNAIRKCKVDLGVTIELDPRAVIPDRASGRSTFHCAVGTIRYHAADAGQADGYLLYIKPSLTGNEPTDILQYAKVHPAFPHEPTADQWFSESQFESYRKLGFHIARTVLEGAAVRGRQDRESIFVALKERWYPAAAAIKTAFSRHADQLKSLHSTLRSTPELAFLDAQIYPEWDALLQGKQGAARGNLSLPADASQIRAGFYFCSQLLGLMESVYLDLDLEEAYDHPDNRGWLNLFKHWSWSTMLQVTYAICCATYGARFQTFCRERLDLVPGKIRVERPRPPRSLGDLRTDAHALAAWLQALEDRVELNFEEARIVRDYAARGVPFDELLLLRLRVQDPSKPGDTSPGGRALEFSYGFALADGDKAFVFYRVQDHLRRMGLARDGLIELCAQGYVRIAAHAPNDDPASRERFEALLRSAVEELNERAILTRAM